MSVRDRLAGVLAELMRADENRLLLGEDVVEGGILGLSHLVARDPALASRVIATPLTSTAGLAHAAGLALAGARPIVLLSSSAALVEGLSALREVSALHDRAGERAQVLYVAPNGAGFGLGGDGAACFESAIGIVPGLRVHMAGLAGDLESALRTAAEFDERDGPAVLLLPRTTLLDNLAPEAPTSTAPLGPVALRRTDAGARATVFCWGSAVESALAAADAAHDAGRPCEVVELHRLAPLDRQALVASAARTGKIVIAHEGAPEHGLAAEIAAIVADEAILHLDAPIVRVAGGPVTAFARELATIPSAAAIADAIVNVVDY